MVGVRAMPNVISVYQIVVFTAWRSPYRLYEALVVRRLASLLRDSGSNLPK